VVVGWLGGWVGGLLMSVVGGVGGRVVWVGWLGRWVGWLVGLMVGLCRLVGWCTSQLFLSVKWCNAATCAKKIGQLFQDEFDAVGL